MSMNRKTSWTSWLCMATIFGAGCSLQEVNYAVLKVDIAGEGEGSVLETKFGGINCSPDCEEAYGIGATVELTPDSLRGSTFQGWSGDCEGQDVCQLTMDGPKNVTATFGVPSHRLTVYPDGTGTGTVTSNPPGIICGYDCIEDYPSGRFVSLTATSTDDSKFLGWGGACEGQVDCRVQMDGARTVTAKFERIFHRLSVEVDNPTFGHVRSFPVGIACGDQCQFDYVKNTVVKLDAEAMTQSNEKFIFVGWEGDCSGTGDCTLTMTSSKSVRAKFVKNFRIAVTKSGARSGTVLSTPPGISCGSICDSDFPIGERVQLTALPDVGARFVQWSGDCTGSGACEVVVDKDIQINAEFDTQYVGLNVIKQGVGSGQITSSPAGIDCGTDCSERYPLNTGVILTATPDTDSEFAGWVSPECNHSLSTCRLTLTATTTVYANFDRFYPVSVTLGGPGRGTVTSDLPGIDCGNDCDEPLLSGTTITLTATPEPGHEFVGWSGDCSGIGSCQMTIDGAKNVSASFEPILYPVGIAISGAGFGSISGAGGRFDCGHLGLISNCVSSIAAGTEIVLTASVAPGSTFRAWEGVCGTGSTCTLTIDRPMIISAAFDPKFALVSATVDSLGADSSEVGHRANEAPARNVRIARSFWMKATEVTRREWQRFMPTDPSAHLACGLDCPVNNLSYGQVVEYLNRLSGSEDLEPCYQWTGSQWDSLGAKCAGYRLPTEAEWELAVRNGTDSAVSNGDITAGIDACSPDLVLNASAWHCGNASQLQPVAQKSPNTAGLFDVHGNVWEWTQDMYQDDAYSLTAQDVLDPNGPGTSTDTPSAVRGGSFASFPRDCRSASRASSSNVDGTHIGFRPVRSNFRRVVAGTFDMGSTAVEIGHSLAESPRRAVTLARDLYVGATEVTQGQWIAVVPGQTNPSSFVGCGEDCPVEQVSYDSAVEYLNALSTYENRSACYQDNSGVWVVSDFGCEGYRLPTEAEWEYAARAGTTTSLYNGQISNGACADPLIDEVAWYCGNATGSTHQVGEKLPNKYGLYDVYGNVAEWTQDYYSASYYSIAPQLSPTGPLVAQSRAIRGGNYDGFATLTRSAARADYNPSLSSPTIGFRTVRNACGAQAVSSVSGSPDSRARRNESTVWTGTEFVVFGGANISPLIPPQNISGHAYHPGTDTWRDLPVSNGVRDLTGASTVWTGSEILTWGGRTSSTAFASFGRRYDPVSNQWSLISTQDQLSVRMNAMTTWTGSQWIILGGTDGMNTLSDGRRYLPKEDMWLPIATPPLVARYGAATFFIGGRVLVAAGQIQTQLSANDYALYDPATNTWSSSGFAGGCSGVSDGVANDRFALVRSQTGWCVYDSQNNQWQAVPTFPDGRTLPDQNSGAIVARGGQFLVASNDPLTSTGVIDAYNPADNTWRQIASGIGWDISNDIQATSADCGLFVWSRGQTAAQAWKIQD